MLANNYVDSFLYPTGGFEMHPDFVIVYFPLVPSVVLWAVGLLDIVL